MLPAWFHKRQLCDYTLLIPKVTIMTLRFEELIAQILGCSQASARANVSQAIRLEGAL